MADSKLTGATVQTVATTDDLLLMMDGPATTALLFKITVANVFNSVATSSILSIGGLALGAVSPVANQIMSSAGVTIVAAGDVAITLSGAAQFQIDTTGVAFDLATGNWSIGIATSASYRHQRSWSAVNGRTKLSNSVASSASNDIAEEFYFKNSSAVSTKFVEIFAGSVVTTAGSEIGSFEIRCIDAGVMKTPYRQYGSKSVFGGAAGTPTAQITVTAPSTGVEVFKEESVAAGDDPGLITMCGYLTTTSATVGTVLTIPMTVSTTCLIQVKVSARRTGGAAGTADDGAGYRGFAVFKTSSAGTVTLIGASTFPYTGEDQAAWNVAFAGSGQNVLIRVTGAASNDISWACVADILRIGA